MEEGLNFFNLHLRILSLTGTLPSDEFRKTAPLWKKALYFVHQVLPCLCLLPVFIGQLLALIRYREDVVLTCDNAGQMAILMLCLHPRMHLSFTSKHIRHLVEQLEHSSVLNSQIVQKELRVRGIIDKTRRSVDLATKFLFVAITTCLVLLVCAPLLLAQHDEESPNNKNSTKLTARQLFKSDGVDRLHFIMYLPVDVNKWFTELYVLQGLFYLFGYTSLIGNAILYTGVIVRLVGEFEAVATCIEYLDMNVEPENGVQIGDELLVPAINLGTIPTAREYIAEVTKIHLVAIKSASNVEQLIRAPGIIIQFSFMTIITVCLFMVSLLREKAVKFFFILVVTLTECLIITIVAEMVSLQGLRVAEELYNCQWYERSTPFKRHLMIMLHRAQRPVELKIAKLIPIRLTLFADVTRTCYNIFAVLLQLHTD